MFKITLFVKASRTQKMPIEKRPIELKFRHDILAIKIVFIYLSVLFFN